MSRDTQALKLEVSPTGRWIAMYSGSPTSWGMVAGPAMGALKGGQETLADVRLAFDAAFQNELTRRIESAVLSPYRMTLAEWTHEGLTRFGPAEFARLN